MKKNIKKLVLLLVAILAALCCCRLILAATQPEPMDPMEYVLSGVPGIGVRPQSGEFYGRVSPSTKCIVP